MPSHVALNLVNGMLRFTITKNELLTSFKLFDFADLYLNGIYRTNIRYDVLSNQKWRLRYRRNGSSERLF